MRAILPILTKEVLHIVRDARSLGAALVLPLLMLLMFGYAIRIDVRNIDLAVVDQDKSPASRNLVAKLTADRTVRVVTAPATEDRLLDDIELGAVRMGLVIPYGYGRELAAGKDSPIELLVDGTDATFAGQALGLIGTTLRAVTIREVERTLRQAGGPRELPGLVSEPRVLFNEALDGTWFVVPGLIAVIVSMLAAMLTSQCVAREYEQGTIEQILVSPVSGPAIMLGKLLPYVGIGVLQVFTVTLASRFLFDVPIRGSLLLLSFSTLLYLFGSMALGLMFSAVLKSQQVAMQVAFIATMLPSLILSGFIFPIENMPLLLRIISYAVPARYFIGIARGLFLKGVGIEILWPQLLAMLLFATVLVGVATSRFRRTLA